MTVDRYEGKTKYPSFGECIYCGALATETKLTDEHVIPLSLGGKVVILDGSCRPCAAETCRVENEIARKLLWDFRVHAKTPTRRPKERPTALPFSFQVEGRQVETKTVPIDEHPFSVSMPVWGEPGVLTGEPPTAEFRNAKAHVSYWHPPHIHDILGASKTESAQIAISMQPIDLSRFARAIAKMAYCQAILRYGLHGFRRLVLPDLILGRYPNVPYFVGSQSADPPPPTERTLLHVIEIETEKVGSLRLIVARVRLFANSGTDDHGPPIYEVVVGAHPLSQHQTTKRAFRNNRPSAKSIIIPPPSV